MSVALVSPIFYEVGYFDISVPFKQRRLITKKYIYLLPVSNINEYDEIHGVLEGYIGENGRLSGVLTQIMSQKYYYLISNNRLFGFFDKSVFTEIIDISDEENRSYDLIIISSVYARAIITSIEKKLFGDQTARGFFGITNMKDRVMTNFISGGIPYGKNVPPGYYDILQKNAKGFYRIEARDRNYGDDRIEGTDQWLIRLHAYGRGNTFGCISIINSNDWNKIDKIIQGAVSTITTIKHVYYVKIFKQNLIPPINRGGSEGILKHGILNVTENLLTQDRNDGFDAITGADAGEGYIW
jgi:hypothetical protein